MRSVRTAALLALSLALTASAFGATPVILSIDPSTVIAGGPSFTLTVNGANFAAGAVVRVNGVGQGTNFVSASKLTATIPSTLIVNQGTLSITAINYGSAVWSPMTLTLAPNQPTMSTLDPFSVPAGNQNVNVTINVTHHPTSA